jgi:hypothetical protein
VFQQPDQVGLQRLEALQLAADLGQASAQQVLGVPAGALALVGDLEQLADLPQPQLAGAQPGADPGVAAPITSSRTAPFQLRWSR